MLKSCELMSQKYAVISHNPYKVEKCYYRTLIAKRGGGVALYIDSKLKFEPALELNQMDCSDFESAFAHVSIFHRNIITVGVIYRPPGGNIKEFNKSFDILFSTFKGCHNKVF